MIDDPRALSAGQTRLMLDELERINRLLGGISAVEGAVQQVVANLSVEREAPIRILDVGCGSADIPRAFLQWAEREKVPLQILAVDFNGRICRLAAESNPRPDLSIVQADARSLPFAPKSFDIVTCSSFLHHFDAGEVVALLKSFRKLAKVAVLWSDLRRSLPAFLGIFSLTRLFSSSEAIRHDGPLSVRKGFRSGEVRSLLDEAGVSEFILVRKWAFRFLVSFPTGRASVNGRRAAP
jgi:SAM-dependent methyltransferase